MAFLRGFFDFSVRKRILLPITHYTLPITHYPLSLSMIIVNGATN
jgi:hypothetical protein